MTSNSDWIKQRLPSDAAFTKNGVTLAVADAVSAAITDNTSAGTVNKYHALADLLEILAAEYKTYSERAGSGAWTQSLLMERSHYWRNFSATGDGRPGTPQMVDIDYGEGIVSDEFSH